MKTSVQIFVILVFIFSSCSVTKRSYRNGYYISWNHKIKRDNRASEEVSRIKPLTQEQRVKEEVVSAANEKELASVNNYDEPLKEIKPSCNLFKDTCGDIITLRKGPEVKARVLEINETQIKYRRCDNPDGPLIILNKNDVYSIKFTNGTLEHFERTVVMPAKNTNGEKKVHPLAYATLACTVGILLLSFVALIAALIVGSIAKAKILSEPDQYTGLEMVRICMTICWVLLALAVFFIALFLLLFI